MKHLRSLAAAACLFTSLGCASEEIAPRSPADDPSSPAAPEAPLAAVPSPSAGPAALPEAPAAPAGPVIYTCPMHPEVVRDAPGECPQCGMGLVPKPKPKAQGAPAHQHYEGVL